MDLVRRGRLSVQRVQPEAWEVIEQLADKGGWIEETKGNGRAKKGREEEEASIIGKRTNEEGTGADTDARRRSKRRTGVKS